MQKSWLYQDIELPLIARRSRSRQVAAAAAVNRRPAISTLMRKMSAEVAPDSRRNAVLEFLNSQDDWVRNSLTGWLHELAEDPLALPPFRELFEGQDSPFSAVKVVQHPAVNVTIQAVSGIEVQRRNEAGRTVQFSGKLTWLKILRGQNVRLSVWRCSPFREKTDLATLSCRQADSLTLSTGDVLEVDGREMSISFAGVTEPVAYVHVVDRHLDLGISVDFDARTGRFIGAHPADRHATRVMAMASALRHLGQPERSAILQDIARRGPYYQRWHVAREALAAGITSPEEFLREFCSETMNPSVRRAAEATLSHLSTLGAQS